MTSINALDPRIARSGTATTAAPPDNTLGKDAFLKLLVAQMKYQDPMNPADGTEFVAQTAQFTMVEKLVAMEAQNEQLLQSQQSLTASTFIGRDVAWATKDDTGAEVTHTGTVAGVTFGADGPLLRVGDEDVPLRTIRSVAPIIDEPTEAPPAGEAPATDSTATDGDSTGTDAVDPNEPDPTD